MFYLLLQVMPLRVISPALNVISIIIISIVVITIVIKSIVVVSFFRMS